MTDIRDIELTMLDGSITSLRELAAGPALVVNVASRCGLTPQYTALEAVARKYADRGLTVLGVPCNQFAGQEPGTAAEIREFCSTAYDVTFPLLAKTDVNGTHRHPLYAALTARPETAGDITWNFEKFLVAADGTVVERFGPRTAPDAPEVLAAIERLV